MATADFDAAFGKSRFAPTRVMNAPDAAHQMSNTLSMGHEKRTKHILPESTVSNSLLNQS